MKRRIVSAGLALCLALALLPTGAWAADETGTWGDLTWSYNGTTGLLTISGSGVIPDADVEQPPYPYNIKSVVIGSGVTGIGQGAFYCCSSLTSVTIPDTVTSIGDEAFY